MLAEFARFLSQEHRPALTRDYLRFARELGVPALRQLAEEDGRRLAEESMADLLGAMAQRNAVEAGMERLGKWEKGRHPWLPGGRPTHQDLVLLFAAQRRAFMLYLPRYTTDQAVTLGVMWALEDYFTHIQSRASEVYERWRVQDSALIEALENAHERDEVLLESIISLVPISVAALDRACVVQWASPAACTMLGLRMTELAGHAIFDVLPRAEGYLRPMYERAFSGETVIETAFPLVQEVDGRERTTYWDFQIHPMRIHDETISLVLFMGMEVSERVEKERLQRERIQVLERLDRAKDEFLSVLSHELRTPINCILGFTSLLRNAETGLASDQQECLGEIAANAVRMRHLIEDLLDIAKVRAGKLDLAFAAVPFAPLVEGVIAGMHPLIAEKALDVGCDVRAPEPVYIDRLRVIQVLTNLLSNAVKFSRPGGRIAVRAWREGPRLVAEVQDFGCGFLEPERALLFTPFQQLDMGRTRAAAGTGLGLSISKALVEAHGGGIEAASPGLGLGATFRFWLPA